MKEALPIYVSSKEETRYINKRFQRGRNPLCDTVNGGFKGALPLYVICQN